VALRAEITRMVTPLPFWSAIVERIFWAIREPEPVYDVAGRSSAGSGHHVPSLSIPGA